MTSWSLCSPDEYALLFPKLVPRDGLLPPVLVAHLAACVVVRSRRLARVDADASGCGLRSRVSDDDDATLEQAWFADGRMIDRVLRRLGLRSAAPGRQAADARLLTMLDLVLDEVQRGVAPRWDEDREAWFAFGSGIHPAYLWAESAISPARGCTAAWLGHLDRGRSALMPPAVAEYLTDCVLDPLRGRDTRLAAMVGTAQDRKRLGRAAARRLAGDDPVVFFGNTRGLLHAEGPPSGAWRAGERLQHA